MLTMKKRLQSFLKWSGLYYRLVNSSLYELYWRVVDRRVLDVRDAELSFYRGFLEGIQKDDLVFDIGANVGWKTDIFLRLGARVVSVDPDELNQRILRGKFLKYRAIPKPVVIVGKAVSSESGIETMLVDGPGSALNTLSQKWASTLKSNKDKFEYGHFGLEFSTHKSVESTTIEDLIASYGVPFFVKIDVEGYEVNVIRGLRQPVPFLSFEVNLPEFRREGLECVQMLERLSAKGEFNCASNLRQGAISTWVGASEFSKILENCGDGGIEVFWRAPVERRVVSI